MFAIDIVEGSFDCHIGLYWTRRYVDEVFFIANPLRSIPGHLRARKTGRYNTPVVRGEEPKTHPK